MKLKLIQELQKTKILNMMKTSLLEIMAKENTSVANQTSREMELIQNEIKKRKETQK